MLHWDLTQQKLQQSRSFRNCSKTSSKGIVLDLRQRISGSKPKRRGRIIKTELQKTKRKTTKNLQQMHF